LRSSFTILLYDLCLAFPFKQASQSSKFPVTS
jgi:hypothetical protein